ncbi:MAG: hypothetical protein V1685_05670 [Parcubacteria group bacterium]
MRLSSLQKYILRECHGVKGAYKRNRLSVFYAKQKDAPKGEDQQNTITKSLERLIDKELLIGLGRRTPHMWFIDDIKLTAKGKKVARHLLGEQQSFVFHFSKKK